LAALLPQLALARSPWLLGLLLFLFGAGNGAMDCAMNIQAAMDERDSGRPMMSGFHAFYSIGGFAGVGVMTAMLSLGLSAVTASLLATAALLGAAAVHCRHWRTDRAAPGTPALAWPQGGVMLIGLLCFISF